MVCHGELVRSKPHPRYLTSFYLTVAAGGALGGVFVTLVAPHLFKGFWEYQLGLWLCVFLALLIVVRDRESWLYQSRVGSPVVVVAVAALLPEATALAPVHTGRILVHLPAVMALLLVGYVFLNRNRPGNEKARQQMAPVFCSAAWLLLGTVLVGTVTAHTRTAVALSRNFYGVLGVFPSNPDDPQRAAYVLKHGRVTHGVQFRAPDRRRLATLSTARPAGLAWHCCGIPGAPALKASARFASVWWVSAPAPSQLTASLGTTFAFMRSILRLFESPSGGSYFTYLKDCRARVEVAPGDARISMERELEREGPQKFDVLAIDAFTGDAIPIRLLTEEAFQIYLKHSSRPEAIIALHISNSYLDLRPVVLKLAGLYALAQRLGQLRRRR